MRGKPKGHPKSGGRKKGTPNAKTFNAKAIAEELGVDPFRLLLLFASGDFKSLGYEAELYHAEKPDGTVTMGYVITPELRAKCASEATKYLYPQRKAVELSNGAEGDGFAIVIKDYSKK